jgi:GGDEF domain-containing protein
VHCALVFIDLDNFKQVNDDQDHEAGDQLLVEVAQRLSHCVREEDTVARVGVDEFVILLKHLGQDADSADELLRQADLAMYQAKAGGKNSHAFFEPSARISSHESDYLSHQLGHGGRTCARNRPRPAT